MSYKSKISSSVPEDILQGRMKIYSFSKGSDLTYIQGRMALTLEIRTVHHSGKATVTIPDCFNRWVIRIPFSLYVPAGM